MKQIILMLLFGVLVAGCQLKRPQVTTEIQSGCSRIWQQRQNYILTRTLGSPSVRGVVVAVVMASSENDDKARKISLKNYQKPKTSLAKTELANAETELLVQQSETAAVIQVLNNYETNVEAGKAELRECFGVEFSGRSAAEKYSGIKNQITKQRGYTARKLNAAQDRYRTATERVAIVEGWRKKNIDYLKRETGKVELNIVEVAKSRDDDTLISIVATNISKSTILRPINFRGGYTPIGTSLSDSFGNFFKFSRVRPQYSSSSGKGIRPNETRVFNLQFSEIPLETAKSVRISIEPNSYGQSKRVVFDIPTEIFFQGMVMPSETSASN